MNNYLLDTHILLWWLSDDKKLAPKIKDVISDANNTIIVSTVTILEIIIKKSLKKLDAPDDLKEVIELNNFIILPMTIDHALLIERLPHIHYDPFDRLLIAQTIIEDLIFITDDKIIRKYEVKCL